MLVREFDGLEDYDHADSRTQVDESREAASNAVDQALHVRESRRGLAKVQRTLDVKWAAAQQRYARAELGAADNLRAGGPDPCRGMLVERIRLIQAEELINAQRLKLHAREAELARALSTSATIHNSAQKVAAAHRMATEQFPSDRRRAALQHAHFDRTPWSAMPGSDWPGHGR